MPFNRLKAHIVGNRIRQWLTENLGLVPLWLDPHIDPIAEFIVAEKEENVEEFEAALAIVLDVYNTIDANVINITEARTVGLAAYQAIPKGLSFAKGTVAILVAFQADPKIFPNQKFSYVENLILGALVKALSGQSLFTASADGADDVDMDALLAACRPAA